ncbi:hypothetical protein Tsubulata_013834 [Turnera subulata]|uniref:SAM domain-containing protein n=1 Tax=Turnera subulata TaxID=218843 RepID=A0A9Q0JIY9_9ROSI|nr:hypothetical protein Tsubulata_013834 [Turnera subulata]
MDWFSWLANTNLDSTLVYEYGLAFARNELQAEDLAHFNHEFLQSMGISVAKHRLEILKLARKEVRAGPNSLSRLILAMNKTKKSLKKCFTKWVSHHQDSSTKATPEGGGGIGLQWKGALSRKWKSGKELKLELPPPPPPPILKSRQVKSGPLDGRLQENLMGTAINRNNLKLSGPLDGKIYERFVFSNGSPMLIGIPDGRVPQRYMVNNSRSPRLTASFNGRPASPKPFGERRNGGGEAACDFDDNSLWTALFRDMKPT